MADADLGNGRTTKIDRHMRIVLDDGTTQHVLSKPVRDSFSLTEGGRRTYAEMNNGDFDGDVHEREEQLTEIAFAVKGSPDNLNAVDAVARPASVGGIKTKFSVVLRYYDDDTLTTGRSLTFADCYVPEGGLSIGDSGEVDEIALRIMSLTTRGVWGTLS